MKTLAAIATLTLLAFAVPANAQGTGLNLEATNPGKVDFKASDEIPFTLTVGCLDFLTNGGLTATVTVTDAPVWFNFTEQSVAFSPDACANPSASASETGAIPFTLSADAPAIVSNVVHLKATLGDAGASNEAPAVFTVNYTSDYSLTPSVKFPLTVTNKTTTFTVTGMQASNAPSMIMVDGFSASDGALVSGIGPLQYLNDAGKPDTKTYTVSFTAPAGDWDSVNITLQVYGHYNFPDGSGAGDPTDQKTLTWQVLNGGVKTDLDGEGEKKSPAPVGVLTALGLLAFAGLRRRKA